MATVSFTNRYGTLCECVMGRTELLKRLEEVEHQIAHDIDLITRDRNILAESGKAVDADAIRIMLAGLENLLVVHLQERAKLQAELAQLAGPSRGPPPSDRS
jgi:hypothetical protein